MGLYNRRINKQSNTEFYYILKNSYKKGIIRYKNNLKQYNKLWFDYSVVVVDEYVFVNQYGLYVDYVSDIIAELVINFDIDGE